MTAPCDVTIVLSTYNRAPLLGPAIERLLSQSPETPPYEIVLVDNNSTDDTRSIVERFTASNSRVRYVFEARQGLSYARNAGIAAAQGDIVAFTDDDVRVAHDWVKVVKETFDRHPEVDSLGGRTLPVWPSPPPRWLTRLHWVGPLALQDYGEEPFIVDAARPLCLAGANLAFRKSVFARIGLFSPDFPRSEDTELMLRFWLSGARALYVPNMTVHAAVQAERLRKPYHRRWHATIGRCNARMNFEELMAASGSLRSRVPEVARVLGVPVFALRQLACETFRWLVDAARQRHPEAFWHEIQARAVIGYIRENRLLHRRRSRARRAPAAASVLEAPVEPVVEEEPQS